MPFFFPPTAFYNSPLISNNHVQLFSPKTHRPMTVLDAIPQIPQPQYAWAPSSDFILNPYPYSYFYSSLSNGNIKPTTKPLNKKYPEPTTTKTSSKSAIRNDLKSDSRLIAAVQKVNPTFEIENIVPIPGTPYFRIASVEKFQQKPKTKAAPNTDIKVEATGKTAAGKAVPDIPFGSYFLPYNSDQQNPGKKTASLILQPSSKAIVGSGGTAISAPISRAVLKKGVPTNVFFNPESVAIAGAGGRAHAQADLILDVMDKRLARLNSNGGDIVSYPYYGGLKGHSLNLNKDGKFNTVVVLNPKYADAATSAAVAAEGRGSSDIFFNKIQDSAARLVAIQEKAKQKGSFSNTDNKLYADSLFELGIAAQSLAQLQQNGDIKDFSKLLQGSNTQFRPQPVNDGEAPSQSADNVSVTQDEPYDDSGESVLVNAPKKDASVAEAKPVGLSIVGEGGVASSKPNGVAISGREGLAVSAPRATAIAGVSPEEAAAFNINVPTSHDIIIKSHQRAHLSQLNSKLVEMKFPKEKIIAKRSGIDAENSSSEKVDDKGKNILLVEPRLADRIYSQEKQQLQPDIESKSLKVQPVLENVDSNAYLPNMAYRNYLLSSFYAS